MQFYLFLFILFYFIIIIFFLQNIIQSTLKILLYNKRFQSKLQWLWRKIVKFWSYY